MNKKEEAKIYFYFDEKGTKYHTPSIELASARGNNADGSIYYETYMVDVIEDKKDKK